MLGQHRRLDWHTLAGARGPAVGDSFLLPLHHHLLGTAAVPGPVVAPPLAALWSVIHKIIGHPASDGR
jgi:hypothetical protein